MDNSFELKYTFLLKFEPLSDNEMYIHSKEEDTLSLISASSPISALSWLPFTN